ncbi:DUF2946 family protein [Acetobacter fallax]|uniref:DUF2946 domain-containing protein n=1 Tax=Acetobacter fallax TaxID=1737473 RepID=A0ABX0KFJ9_9PROT|nr:DUF2946 family protein [Acetobacter fallax]NHO33888.1 DUF2946 domain-containing protein [Acetobacter fallax]NHO37430.1 DUF2946 domain-containing protein [Acetobacter fallax]
MTCRIHPETRSATGRWLVVAFTLLGFIGQLLIGNQALPDEAPRATIRRLTGIDIAAAGRPGVCDSVIPAAMHMAGMTHTSHCHVTHHHDGSCPLCSLLQIPIIILSGLTFLPLPPAQWVQPRYRPLQPRAPPATDIRILPPARGPPGTA